MGKKNSNNHHSGWGINKISFWAITIISLMYLVAQVLRWIGFNNSAAVADWVRSVASALAFCLVAVLAYRYVRNKPVVWLVLYIIVLLILLVFIVLPLALR